MMYSPNSVIIIEGPAGAGKTTLATALSERLRLQLVTAHHQWGHQNPGQQPEDDVIASTSFQADVDKMVWAVQTCPAVIDRLSISQWVYGQLRGRARGTRVEVPDPTTVVYETEGLLRMLLQRYTHHRFSTDITGLAVHWILVVPDANILDTRRRSTGRQYPWSSREEVDLYQNFIDRVHPVLPQFLVVNGEMPTGAVVERVAWRLGQE